MCDGTGAPRGGVGGPQAPKLGGGEERPPTETGGGRPTGQPIEASPSKLYLRERERERARERERERACARASVYSSYTQLYNWCVSSALSRGVLGDKALYHR